LVIASSIVFLSSNSYLTGDPVLPGIPYSYTVNSIPDHLEQTQYGETPDTILTFVDNYKATLGRVLFYDEILSASGDISCGTCHLQEFSFADSLGFSHGVSSSTARNSLQLNDLGWTNNTTYFWDMKLFSTMGRFDTLLENAIQLPLADPNEIGVSDINAMVQKMNMTTYYPGLFYDAYGSSTITEAKVLEALSHFICSMVSFDSKFDQAHDHSTGVYLTTSELNGKTLFERDCQFCHGDGFSFLTAGGPMAVFVQLHNNGMEQDTADRGLGEWSSGMDFLYKIPTLRNIEVTGPYMHNAKFSTLEEVVEHYSDSIRPTSAWIPSPGFGYTQTEKDDLVAFLKTLTDQNLLTHDKWSDPFDFISPIEGEENLEPSLEVYPNPTATHVNVVFENNQRAMTYVEVFSTNGQLMAKRSTHKSTIHIDVSNYSSGTYFIKVRQHDQLVTKQLVVAK